MNGNIELPKIITMEEVEEKEVQWLVPPYIPKNCITIMGGDGGSGKTSVSCGIAAAISTGKKVFFDSIPENFLTCNPQKVLFLSSEDSIEYTLKTKFRKSGADLRNIISVSLQDRLFKDIKFNSPILEALIERERPALVIFDPLQSFIPSNMAMEKRNAMRDCLSCLLGLGEKYSCTFIIICHTNKRSNAWGRKRISDSADIWDIARSVLIVGQTSDGKRYISQEKNSYSEEGQTAIFSINDGVTVFEQYSDKKDRDFVQEMDFCARQAPQRTDAENFIYEFLRDGKKPTKELDEAAEAAGISNHTLRRAKEQLRNRRILGVESEGNGKNKIFYSYLIDKSS